jgi:hypothetical protein
VPNAAASHRRTKLRQWKFDRLPSKILPGLVPKGGSE